MATFVDSTGHEWQVRLTPRLLGRLRTDAGVVLKASGLEQTLTRWADDGQDELGRVVWVLVADQAAADGVTADEFDARFADGGFYEAARAITQAITDFFQPRTQPAPTGAATTPTTPTATAA